MLRKVKKTILIVVGVTLIGLCAITAQAAGGTCPSTAQYVNTANPAGAPVTLASLGITSCYFIAASGSDSLNNGTSEATPFLHAPGMVNCTANCAAVTQAPGLGFIFRGGDTWHYFAGSPQIGLPVGWPTSGSPHASGYVFTHSGTPTNPIYVGVDQTWFTGGSWVRPVINDDNPVITATTAFFLNTASHVVNIPGIATSCAHTQGDLNNIDYPGVSNIITDNIEFVGMCYDDVATTNNPHYDLDYFCGSPPCTSNFYFINMYHHGKSHVAFCNNGLSATGTAINALGSGYTTSSQIAWQQSSGPPELLATANVTSVNGGGGITGLTYTNCGSGYGTGSAQAVTVSGPGSGATLTVSATTRTVSPNGQDMQGNSQQGNIGTHIWFTVHDESDGDDTEGSVVGVDTDAYDFAYNVVNHMGGTNIIDNCHTTHDNIFSNINNATDGQAHTDMWFCESEASANNFYYNNLFFNVATEYNQSGISAYFWINPNAGFTDYFFNNVGHDAVFGGPLGGDPINLGQMGCCGAGSALLLYNNTFESAISFGSGAHVIFGIASSNLISAITSQNNHYITNNGTGCAAVFSGPLTNLNGGVGTCAGDLFQTISVANGQGYTSANHFAPTSTGSPTNTGAANETSLVSQFGPAFASSTTNGCFYNSAAGIHAVICPLLTANAKATTGSSNWPYGAYLFVGSAPPPVPPAPTGLTGVVH